MNWILNAYSEVYSTAMMRDTKHEMVAAPAKRKEAKRAPLFGFLGRR